MNGLLEWGRTLVGGELGPTGRYQIDGVLGAGRMGVVVGATDRALLRHVAVKIVPPAAANTPPRGRFGLEAEPLASLEHSHILPVYDFGVSQISGKSVQYLVMRHIGGGSLDNVLAHERRPPWTLARTVALVRQLVSALDYAHGRKVVHRDLKPSNVLLEPDGFFQLGGYHAFVADFGIAKPLTGGSDAPVVTLTGETLGAHLYMAPEQWLTQPVGPQADQYALGVMLYELLTGDVPYRAETTAELATKVMATEPRSLREQNPRVDADVEWVVLRAMALLARDRYGSCAELLIELVEAAGEGRPTIRRPGP